MKKLLVVLLLAVCTVFANEPYYVGEVGSSWEFPSDHLPRGATIGNFHIAFWNILYKDYLFHIEENTQGLKHSSILRDNVPVNAESSLTVRELISGQMILEMIHHPTQGRSLIALEETHPDVYEFLRKNLSANWKMVTPPGQPTSQDLFLYDADVFDFEHVDAVKYSDKFSKTIFTLTLREKATDQVFRFLQSHIPGGPVNSVEGCAKFSNEAMNQFDPTMIIVLMGDMNQSPSVIQSALDEAAEKKGIASPYSYLPIAHPSHINTKLQASWIDNFFIYSPNTPVKGSDNPEEIVEALLSIIQILKRT